ncbi:MAG: PBP1A family penicillin-binding protein [Candidatus Pristimantibacillus sp.]
MAERPRRKTAPKKGKRKFSGRKWFFGLFFTVVIAIVCGIIGYLLIILNGERILTERADMLVMGEASIIYDVNNEEITKLYHADQNRENVEYDQIPQLMLDAIVATEDQRFYSHSGIDFFAIGRALVKDVIAGSAVEGGSTITQQLAKNMFLTADKTLFRKATEASIAVALENKKTKPEILAMYLNRIYLGKGVYGIKAAADRYFDTDLEHLELWQIATLAGMPKAPSRYNPINDPEASQARRAVVLKLMYDQKYITETEMEEAKAVVYKIPANYDEKQADPYKAYIDYTIEEAIKVMPGMTEEELRIGGYRIYTSLNPKAQTTVENEFADDSNFEDSPDDVKVQGAMIIMDHRDGTIQAMAGGRDYEKKGLNRVEVTRQPGSAFKPITSYGPALETGDYIPSTVLKNDKKCFGDYCPKDSKGATPITMQDAIKHSRNLPAVWMLNEIGVKTGMDFAKKLGFDLDSSNDRNLAIALGGLTNGVTPIQMAEAYSVFANGGKSVDPHTIVKIENASNKKVYTYRAPESKQLMKPETAWYMTQMLQTVVQKGGTGTSAAIDRAVAGKTGTTQHGIPGFNSSANRDAWFVGYTPEWTAAVWMGYDKTNEQHVIQKGSAQSAKLFAKVMREAMKDVPKSSFDKPTSIPEEKKGPSAVQNFNAIFVPDLMAVQLSWEPPAESSSGITYQVFRKEASEAEFIKFNESVSGTTDDMSVFPGMTYEYYVVAYDAESNLTSSQSETITIQIPETEIVIPEVPMEQEPVNPDGNGEIGIPGDGTGEGVTPPSDGSGNNPGNNPEPTPSTEPNPNPGQTDGSGNGVPGATVPPVDGNPADGSNGTNNNPDNNAAEAAGTT